MDKGKTLIMVAGNLGQPEQQQQKRSWQSLPGPARLLVVGCVAVATF
jgi:hypothetical protein